MQKNPNLFSGALFAVLSSFLYASLAIFVKIGYTMGFQAEQMMQYRFLFASAAMFIWLFIKDRSALKASPRLLAKSFLLGGIFYVAQSYLFTSSLAYIPAATTSLILYCFPLIVFIITTAVLKKSQPAIAWLGIGIIMAGCALVFVDAFQQQLHLGGTILAVGGMLVFSVYLVISQLVLAGERTETVAFYVLLSAALVYIPLFDIRVLFTLTAPQMLFSVVIGVVPTAVALFVMYRSVALIGAALSAVFCSVEPAITVTLAILVLGDSFVWVQGAGMLLIIAGIALPNIPRKWLTKG